MALVVKNLPASAGEIRDTGSFLGWGGHGNPLQYSCLENHMERGPWQATVHRVAQNHKWLRQFSMHASWFTILYLFQVYKVMIQYFTNLYFIRYLIIKYLVILQVYIPYPLAYNIFLLLIYFVPWNLYLLIPYPEPPSGPFPLPTGNHWFVFPVCESVYFATQFGRIKQCLSFSTTYFTKHTIL